MSRPVITDVSLAGTAISTPLWLQSAGEWAAPILAVCGVALVILRIAVIIKDWRRGNR